MRSSAASDVYKRQYFARAFKKRTGMTPTQYRRQAGQKAKADPEAGL